MSASEEQIKSNQENAQKSTGPRTDEGKARSRCNALKHGLRSEQLIINTPHIKENWDEFTALLDSFIETLNPRTYAEQVVVARIAVCHWRQQRLAIAETAQIERQLHRVGRDFEAETQLYRYYDRRMGDRENPLPFPDADTRIDTLLRTQVLPQESFSRNLLRYELRTDRSIQRAMEQLRQMRLMRRTPQPKSAQTNPIEKAAGLGSLRPAATGVDPKPDPRLVFFGGEE